MLMFAATLNLNDQERGQLLVPDARNQLRPIQDIVYNDIGSHSLVATLDAGQYIASPKVTDDIATSLGISRLGLKFVLPPTLGEDMGVSPATVVRKTLAQYTEKQFLLEFLANAEDAGASTFEVILNQAVPCRGPFLSDALMKLYSGPSVMVCNDSLFGEEDFNGICRTHIGGKAGDPSTIGQFGLGALTMFHTTEVCPVPFLETRNNANNVRKVCFHLLRIQHAHSRPLKKSFANPGKSVVEAPVERCYRVSATCMFSVCRSLFS